MVDIGMFRHHFFMKYSALIGILRLYEYRQSPEEIPMI